ncbi:MAG: 2-C-methyl-D-erythritol 4-phosphate cytidylyltransferase [Roseivirga sp.]|jgi:2-C-methyl-D-erythritol 4-phosphate cytidylyltransferase
MKKWAVIVAGGSGTRMKSDIPKQFIEIGGKPILMHTLEAYHTAFATLKLILVLPEIQIPFWRVLCAKHKFSLDHKIVSGGTKRFYSVKNGLNAIPSNGIVAIHDGVRPFISPEIIKNSFKVATELGNAIASVAIKDSIRRVNADGTNELVNREDFQLIQTPQTFEVDLIKKAFETEYDPSFTDDASVFELTGAPIHLIEGDYRNIKITTSEDLFTAEAMLSTQ